MEDIRMIDAGKAVIVIGDGLGDWPISELADATPLETAVTPHLDRLAREGESGLMDPIAPGIRASSATAHLAILGMDVQQGDICFRVNFATVDARCAHIN
jgi:2,3-bisphosphoglycerate-independent phosphoglycerate mutase